MATWSESFCLPCVNFEFTECTTEHSEGRVLIFGAKKMILEKNGEMYRSLFSWYWRVWSQEEATKKTKGVSNQNGISKRGEGKQGEKVKNPDNEMRIQKKGKCTQTKLLNPCSVSVKTYPLSWSCRWGRGSSEIGNWSINTNSKTQGHVLNSAVPVMWPALGRGYDVKGMSGNIKQLVSYVDTRVGEHLSGIFQMDEEIVQQMKEPEAFVFPCLHN